MGRAVVVRLENKMMQNNKDKDSLVLSFIVVKIVTSSLVEKQKRSLIIVLEEALKK